MMTLALWLALSATSALAVPVTFQVRMGQQVRLGNFDLQDDFVDVAGTFNGWGTDPLLPLADADGDSVYRIILDGFTPGQTIEYKFRINGLWDGSEEFPGVGNNRIHTVQPEGNEILVWYNDVAPVDTSAPLHWWNDTVFYEIFVRSFQDSDGDGIGDLPGLTSRLDYLNDGDPATDTDLGITGIWLMPVNDAPSYHGYDATDYRTINPDYGTMADFQAFLAAARQRGIRVIVDYVMNHCSNQHPWFTASAGGDPAYRDWFRWAADRPDQTGPWGQDVWHWDDSGWYYGLFWSGMPDLNYGTPAVRDSMFAAAAYWLDTVGVDGFRLDAVLYIDEDGDQLQSTPETLQFWQDFGGHVRSVAPEALTVGEAWTGTGEVLPYASDGRLDLCFEFDLSYAILGAAGGGDAGWVADKIGQVYGQYRYLQFATFLTNHDQDRVLNVLDFDEGRARVAAGIYLTLPGVPFVYYGEEIGMVGSGAHEFIRSPMQWTDGDGAGFTTGTPWQLLNANYLQYNVQVEQEDPGSLLRWYRRLIHLRNDSPALRRGAHHALDSSAAAVLAFVRDDGAQKLLCLANTAATPSGPITLTGSPASLPEGTHTVVDLLDSGDGLEITISADHQLAGMHLDGHQVAVFKFTGLSGTDPGGDAPPRTGLRLQPNHPNPFNPATTVTYHLPATGPVRLSVHDVAGRLVKVLLDRPQPAGRHRVRWDGTDARGQAAGAGVYLMRLEAGGDHRQGKMLLLK